MKKKSLISTLFALPKAVMAQSANTMHLDNDIVKIGIAVASIGAVMLFVLEVVKRFMDYRLKEKALELRISDELASSIFGDKLNKSVTEAIKWFSLFAGLGIGLTIVNYTLPLGFHSLAIMAFSIAAGFLGYVIYLTRSEK